MIKKLTNADCMDVMKTYPDNYFDLAIVDPPYGIGQEWKKNKNNVMYNHNTNYINKSIPTKEYFAELMRISKNQIIWGGNYYTEFLPATNHWIVWDKKVDYVTQHHSEGEMAWHSYNIPLRIVVAIWNGFVKCENVKKQHPHQKPIKLYKWLLTNYAKPGDKIIDTHMGSGSSAIAAHYFDCEFTGIEIDKEYFEDSKKRIEMETKQLALI